MNQLQIFILVLMVIFTIFHFWTDLKNFWNTGNKFGEGFTSSGETCMTEEECKKLVVSLGLKPGGGGHPFAKAGRQIKGLYVYKSGPYTGMAFFSPGTQEQMNAPISPALQSKIARIPKDVAGMKEEEIWQKSSGKPDMSLNKDQCRVVGPLTGYNYPFSVINESGNPKGCFIQHGQSPGAKGIYYNETGTADCGAHGVSLCLRRVVDTPQTSTGTSTGAKGAKIQLAIDGAWNTDINKEFECKPGIHSVDESAAYTDSCKPRDKCNVQINEKCEARIGMWDRCTNKNTDDGGNPSAKQDSETRSLGWSNWITAGGSAAGAKNSCKIKQLVYKQTPEAAAMTAESPSNETPVVNNIQVPPPPEWHDSKLAKQFKLPNGHLVRPGEGVCPNACKIPHYDQKNCANEILDGKEYRTCPWVKDGTNDIDCKNCGAVLIPKNEYGFARTNPALLDVNHVDDVMKITNVEDSKDNKYNMGKNFMKQLSFIRHFALPDSITTDEYVTIGKLVNAHQKYPKSHKIETILTKFINTILRTNSLSENGKNVRAHELVSAQVNAQGGNFDVDEKKLSGEGVLAYKQGLEEAASDNRLGGSKTLYREMTEDSGYTKHYHPRDPRRKPSPYNSIWNIFNY